MALAPSNYGITVDGLVTLADQWGAGDLVNSMLTGGGCQACVEQEQGSSFLAALNVTPTVPSVQYTVIASEDDQVVTPSTNAFLPAAPNVTNITVQNQCPQDSTDHLELAYDPVALADVLNALDPANPVQVPCVPVLPLTAPRGWSPRSDFSGLVDGDGAEGLPVASSGSTSGMAEVENFIEFRGETVGIRWCFDLIERCAHFELPCRTREGALLRNMNDTAVDAIAFINDVQSLERENFHHDPNNTVVDWLRARD